MEVTAETVEHRQALPPPDATIYRVVVGQRENGAEPSSHPLARQPGVSRCQVQRLYFLHGSLTQRQVEQLAGALLADPVTETWSAAPAVAGEQTIEVTLLPGVTDPAAENLVRAAHLLGFDGLERAASGQRYCLWGDFGPGRVEQLATAFCANPVIQRLAVNRPIAAPFVATPAADDGVAVIPLREADEDGLETVSARRRLALNLAEMRAIQAYYRREGRDPTDVELETLAQTWSEHCVHKTFKAVVHYTGPAGADPHGPPAEQTIDGLLRTYIRGATEKVDRPWVRSAFVDNAGIVAFDEQFDLAFKVETHNHPSALEPFGGANTGVGGVVRDVLGVSARPIANTDVLCFGPPDLTEDELPAGVLHPRRVAAGVVHGIADYGNKMGIPTVNGAILYHPGYTSNPLVYCGCLGLLPRDSHPDGARPGDLIVAIGGRTGRDGLRGATFSSMAMDQATGEIAGSAVQIGHPIQEKQVLEVVLRARDERLYQAVTDCGAGGFSSAVGEMGRALGARVQLQKAPLKYPGLRPWEIWLSEAQERMVLAVPPANWPRLQALCAGQDVEAVCLGEFEATGRLRLFYGERPVGDLSMDFLHDGLPRRVMRAGWAPAPAGETGRPRPALPPQAALLALLAHPTVRSKEEVIRRYDHEVQGGTAVKPLVGAADHGPGDATVLVPLDTLADEPGRAVRAVALANGICPGYGELDPYAMAWAAVDEALRNVVAVGADPDQVSLLDNFCWGNPNLPDRLGSLVRCAQGCYDAAVAFQAPFISGKDSLNNEYEDANGRRHAIPGTLLISALAIVPDAGRTTTMDLKRPGNLLYVVGDTRPELGGSLYHSVVAAETAAATPPRPVANGLERLRSLHRAIAGGLVQACHDCSEGGLAVALAEMCLAGRLGAMVDLTAVPVDRESLPDVILLFAESLSRFVVEVRPADALAFEAALGGAPFGCIGRVADIETPTLRARGQNGDEIINVPAAELEATWRGRPVTGWRPAGANGQAAAASAGRAARGAPASGRPKRVLILHANGTNRDREAAVACQAAGGEPEIVHVNQLLAGERRLPDYHLLVVPGGFSYGDDLGAGTLWALDLGHRLGEDVARFVASGRPALGICNGFQALVKAGLLPGEAASRPVTLTFNETGRFECRWVYLRPNPASACLFTEGLDELIYCPVAHGEGRLAVAAEGVAAALHEAGLVALTYADGEGRPAAYPGNPNGSALGIAGLCNPAGNVLGLMPHPEDHIFAWQHPRRHRGEAGLSGLRLFENGLRRA